MIGESLLQTEKKMETEEDGEIPVQGLQVADGTRLLRVDQIVVVVHHKVNIYLRSLNTMPRKKLCQKKLSPYPNCTIL